MSFAARANHVAFVKEYNRIVDEVRDPQIFANTLFTDDCQFTLGNFPPNGMTYCLSAFEFKFLLFVVGRDATAKGAETMYNMCSTLSHAVHKIYSLEESKLSTSS